MTFKWFILYTCRLKEDHNRVNLKILPFIYDSMKNSSFDFEFNYIYLRSAQELKKYDFQYDIYNFKKIGNEIQLDETSINQDTFDLKDWIKEIFPETCDGIIISGHSNGITFEHSDVDIVSLSKIFGKKQKRKIIIFDTCYCGSIETLFEIGKQFKYAIATPSYYVGRSILEMDSFYFEDNIQNDPIFWMKQVCNQLISTDRSYSRVEYPIEIAIYDLEMLCKMVEFMEKNHLWRKLQYDNKCLSIAKKHDDNLYNLQCIIRNSFSGKILNQFLKLHQKTVIDCIYHSLQNLQITLLGIRMETLPNYEEESIICKMKLFKKLCH